MMLPVLTGYLKTCFFVPLCAAFFALCPFARAAQNADAKRRQAQPNGMLCAHLLGSELRARVGHTAAAKGGIVGVENLTVRAVRRNLQQEVLVYDGGEIEHRNQLTTILINAAEAGNTARFIVCIDPFEAVKRIVHLP